MLKVLNHGKLKNHIITFFKNLVRNSSKHLQANTPSSYINLYQAISKDLNTNKAPPPLVNYAGFLNTY